MAGGHRKHEELLLKGCGSRKVENHYSRCSHEPIKVPSSSINCIHSLMHCYLKLCVRNFGLYRVSDAGPGLLTTRMMYLSTDNTKCVPLCSLGFFGHTFKCTHIHT